MCRRRGSNTTLFLGNFSLQILQVSGGQRRTSLTFFSFFRYYLRLSVFSRSSMLSTSSRPLHPKGARSQLTHTLSRSRLFRFRTHARTKIVSRRFLHLLSTHCNFRVIFPLNLRTPCNFPQFFRKIDVKICGFTQTATATKFSFLFFLLDLTNTHTPVTRFTAHAARELPHLLTAHRRWKKAGSAFCTAFESPDCDPFPAT